MKGPPSGGLSRQAEFELQVGLSLTNLAEGQGFEPWEPRGSPVFKTGAIDHSATPPKLGCFPCKVVLKPLLL